jgi:hypothetical protein
VVGFRPVDDPVSSVLPGVLVVLKLATTEFAPEGMVTVVLTKDPILGKEELSSTVVGVSANVGTPCASTSETKIAG